MRKHLKMRFKNVRKREKFKGQKRSAKCLEKNKEKIRKAETRSRKICKLTNEFRNL